MKPPGAYKLLLAECSLAPTSPLTQLSFKIITSTSTKTVEPFSLGTRNMHFNCELLIFESEPLVNIEFVCELPLQPKQIHLNKQKQIVDLVDKSGSKQGSLTVEVETILTQPEEKQRFHINNVLIEFTLGLAPKKELFLLIKEGDHHSRTGEARVKDEMVCQWREEHEFDPEEPHQNMYVECWQGDDEYVGTSVINISKGMNKLIKSPLKDIQDIEIGTVCVKLFDQESFKDQVERSSGLMRPIKVYVLEAILNKELNGKTHTYVNVNLQGSDNKLATTSVFSQDRNPKWNQSFQIMTRGEDSINFELCQTHGKEDREIILATGAIETLELENCKKQVHLSSRGAEVGKLYIEIQSKQPKKQDHKSPPSKIPAPADKSKSKQKPQPKPQSPQKKPDQSLFKQSARSSKFGNSQTLQQLKQMKAKYTGKTMYQYYNDELNEALREGLLMVGKQKPSDPIRELGLFLMNYKR